MKLRPLQDWVVITRSEPAVKSSGGIIIPESAKEKQSEGLVEAVGPGRIRKGKRGERFVPTVLQPGQRVFFGEYSARDIDLDGQKISLIREEDVLGVLEDNGAHHLEKQGGKAASREKGAREEKTVRKRTVKKAKRTTSIKTERQEGKEGRISATRKKRRSKSAADSAGKIRSEGKRKSKKTLTAGKTLNKNEKKGKVSGRTAAGKGMRRRSKTGKKVASRTKKRK